MCVSTPLPTGSWLSVSASLRAFILSRTPNPHYSSVESAKAFRGTYTETEGASPEIRQVTVGQARAPPGALCINRASHTFSNACRTHTHKRHLQTRQHQAWPTSSTTPPLPCLPYPRPPAQTTRQNASLAFFVTTAGVRGAGPRPISRRAATAKRGKA